MRDWLAQLDGLLPALAAEAEAAPGREVCGFVLAEGGRCRLDPARNVAVDPARRFEIAPRDLFALHRRLREGGLVLCAVYHSHPEGGAGLSAADREAMLLEDGTPVLPGIDQLVIGLRQGRAEEARVHRAGAGGLPEVARARRRTDGEGGGWELSPNLP